MNTGQRIVELEDEKDTLTKRLQLLNVRSTGKERLEERIGRIQMELLRLYRMTS